jgi:hypothetical protein
MSALLCSTFGSKNPRLDFKTIGQILGVVAADIVYDPSETYRILGIDAALYEIGKTLIPVVVESLKA